MIELLFSWGNWVDEAWEEHCRQKEGRRQMSQGYCRMLKIGESGNVRHIGCRIRRVLLPLLGIWSWSFRVGSHWNFADQYYWASHFSTLIISNLTHAKTISWFLPVPPASAVPRLRECCFLELHSLVILASSVSHTSQSVHWQIMLFPLRYTQNWSTTSIAAALIEPPSCWAWSPPCFLLPFHGKCVLHTAVKDPSKRWRHVTSLKILMASYSDCRALWVWFLLCFASALVSFLFLEPC